MLSNDWSANDREEWTVNWLGECEKKVFQVMLSNLMTYLMACITECWSIICLQISHGFRVKLSKDGDDGLVVQDVTVIAGKEECSSFLFINMGCEVIERESFSCGSYHLGSTEGGRKQTKQTNACRTKEYGHHTVKSVAIEVGDDGSDDDIHVEICSDVDNRCCDSIFNSWANDFQRKS